jgi:tetratricopeptide (TPR) repeat protein
MIQQSINQLYKKGSIQEQFPFLKSPKILKALSFHFGDIIADMLWIRCVRYIYNHYHNDNQYIHLRDMLNQIVIMNPKFIDVYWVGAQNLLIMSKDSEGAIALLQKGIKHNPKEWLLFYNMGLCYHLGMKDQKMALYYYKLASECKDAPSFISDIILRIQKDDDDIKTIYRMWEWIYYTTTMKNLKRVSKERMIHLKTKREYVF